MNFEKISIYQWIKDANSWQGERIGKLTKMFNDLNLPKRATKNSAGYDFFAPYDFELAPKQTIKIPTGIKVELDSDKVLLMMPRSGQGFKYKVQLYNTVGVIDSDYYNNENNEGHIWIKLYNDSPDGKTLSVKQGDAICQGIIMQYYTTDEDSAQDVRKGGFGSTSK